MPASQTKGEKSTQHSQSSTRLCKASPKCIITKMVHPLESNHQKTPKSDQIDQFNQFGDFRFFSTKSLENMILALQKF